MKPSNFLRFAAGLLICAQAGHAQTATPWVAIGPQRSTVLALQRDPFNSQNVWAGTYFGGLYKSVNSGYIWAPVAAAFGGFTVFAIAFDPQISGTFYVGTFQGGVYKTQDGGQTWTASNQGLTDTTIQALAVNPFDSKQLMAVTQSGVFRSTDGAASWAISNSGLTNIPGRSLVYAPNSNGLVYLGTLGSGVYRSIDSGAHWTGSTPAWKRRRSYRPDLTN